MSLRFLACHSGGQGALNYFLSGPLHSVLEWFLQSETVYLCEKPVAQVTFRVEALVELLLKQLQWGNEILKDLDFSVILFFLIFLLKLSFFTSINMRECLSVIFYHPMAS